MRLGVIDAETAYIVASLMQYISKIYIVRISEFTFWLILNNYQECSTLLDHAAMWGKCIDC